METTLLGIDIGTSSCKAVAFRTDGTVKAQASENYGVLRPHAGWEEQDPDIWWQAVCGALHTLFEKGVSPAAIAGVGVDGQSWSAVAADRRGAVLCNTPIWTDTRAQSICDELNKRPIGAEMFRVSGNLLRPSYTMPKVLWYKEFMPDVYKHTYKILQSNGFIAMRLTGVPSQDVSQGYGWACYSMANGRWEPGLCTGAGLSTSLLPDIVPCHKVIGNVTKEAAKQTGLLRGTPVVAGGLDAACATLGVGAIHPGETQEQGGQAGGMSICADTCRANRRLILSPHVVPGLWLLQGGTVAGGGAVNWFSGEFCAQESFKAKEAGTSTLFEMDRAAETVPPGSGGLVFLPYLAGERSPIWDSRAKGVFYGIDFAKTRAHFARAVMEGVAYSVRHNIEAAQAGGAHIDVLRAMGGAANSRLWMQIKADITGKSIEVCSSDTATALGAAILAGVGTGVYAGFEDAVGKTVKVKRRYEPDVKNASVYEAGYAVYRELYEALKNIMHGGKANESSGIIRE